MSITGQVGHVAFAKQTAWGTPNTTAGQYKAVKITGDSLVASNNMLVAEGEIGTGRDVSQAIPGGFSAAGAVNGNLRARAAALFLEGSLGTTAVVPADGVGPPQTVSTDHQTPADDLPVYTIEKKVGTTGSELLTLRYQDAMVNTFSLSAPSGGLATFSAGIIAAGESYIASPVATIAHSATSDDLLAFHGGRIKLGDSADGGAETLAVNETFQSMEVSINNNVQADEYTVRPSRFLRSLTEGIRTIEANVTLVFEDYAAYQKYTYGANARTTPGYSLYLGALEFTLCNWQIVPADVYNQTSGSGTGIPATNAQAVQVNIHKLAFSGLPVTLAAGRIAVSTTARALKPSTGPIIDAYVRPTAA